MDATSRRRRRITTSLRTAPSPRASTRRREPRRAEPRWLAVISVTVAVRCVNDDISASSLRPDHPVTAIHARPQPSLSGAASQIRPPPLLGDWI
ncbi:hypothetical protein M6B38_324750 [Iris pallida]|uniref:Uncharacterized protein n=1 Tax=Iris pallida TaxID=29817 RepID=A0AAX6H8I8_IRIPA|nr:hypothetical protein M6B38_324750 [Iris pallida]